MAPPDKAVAAMRSLLEQFKKSPAMWYYYGVALTRNSDLTTARDAFKQALKLDSGFLLARVGLSRALLLAGQFEEAAKEGRRVLGGEAKTADPHFVFARLHLLSGDGPRALAEAEAAIKATASFAPAFLVRHQALLQTLANSRYMRPEGREQRRELLNQAVNSLQEYLALPNAKESSLREVLQTLRFYQKACAEDPGDPARQLFFAQEVTTRARIQSKAEPQYTEAARAAQMRGTVMLFVVLSANGNVEHPLVMQSLPFGLAEKSIEAAHQIRFTPAIKDGRAVSTWLQVEYNFNLY